MSSEATFFGIFRICEYNREEHDTPKIPETQLARSGDPQGKHARICSTCSAFWITNGIVVICVTPLKEKYLHIYCPLECAQVTRKLQSSAVRKGKDSAHGRAFALGAPRIREAAGTGGRNALAKGGRPPVAYFFEFCGFAYGFV